MTHRRAAPRTLLVALLCGLVCALAAGSASAEEPTPTVLVQLAKLEPGSLPRIITAFGRIEASPSARQTIQAPLAAVVDAVYVKPGEQVAAAAPLIRLAPSPATASSYAQAESALRAARETERRTRSMLAQHLATAQQLADAEKAVADAQASLAALRAEGAAHPQILRAPEAAVVTGVSISPGAIVSPGAALLELAQPSALVLRVGLVPERAASVQTGDEAAIGPLGAAATIPGRVLLRGAAIDAGTGLVPIDISLPPDGGLLPGETAQAAITAGQVAGYVVPHAALLVDQQGRPYLVQVENGKAHRVPVRVLLAAGEKDVVAGALDRAAPLVLAGGYQLQNGMPVRTGNSRPEAGR